MNLNLFVAHSFDGNPEADRVTAFRSAVRAAIEAIGGEAAAKRLGRRVTIEPFFENRESGTLLPVALRAKLGSADIVLVDISGLSPNVLYELGYAHGLDQDLIVVRDKSEPLDVPDDIRDFVVGFYARPEELTEHVTRRLEEMLDPTGGARRPRERCFWFGPDVADVQVICSSEPEASQFAQMDSENYLFIDGLEDRDAMMEVAMFLSRSRPHARVVRHASGSLMPDVLESDLVVLGGPMNNHVARVLMKALGIGLEYDLNTESVLFGHDDDVTRLELKRDKNGLIVRDVGFFGRFVNPFDSRHHVVLCQGYHTFGTLAATMILSDVTPAIENRRWLASQLPVGNVFGLDTLQVAFNVEVLPNRRVLVPDISSAKVLYG